MADPFAAYRKSNDPFAAYRKSNDPFAAYRKPKDEDENYSAFRSGAVDFLESAVGAGDELDALLMRVSGDADSWDEAIERSRANLERFESENETLSKALDVTGVVAGLLIPGMGAAKIASAGTKAAQIGRAAAFGAAEGAAYGFLSGEGDERLSSAALGAGVGGAAGGLAAKYLMKTDDEIAEAARKAAGQRRGAGHIAGEEGFVNVGKIKERGIAGIKKDDSLKDQVIKRIDDDAVELLEKPEGQSGVFGNIALGLKEFTEKNVGVRAARLAEDAESMARRGRVQIDEVFEAPEWQQLGQRFEANKKLKNIALRINPQREDAVKWSDILTDNKFNLSSAELDDFRLLKQKFDDVAQLDPARGLDDYLPTQAKGEINKVSKDTMTPAATTDDYISPVDALRQYANDVNDAAMLANRFDIPLDSIKVKGDSRMESVINAIRKKAKAEGASEEVADNLRSVLRTQFVASRQGAASVGSIARRATSVALLGNWGNALLNTAEGITAPVMQNGIRDWLSTVPDAIISTIAPSVAGKSGRWLTDAASGHKGQYMGEIVSSGREAIRDSAEQLNWIKWAGSREAREKVGRGVDAIGEKAFNLTGVTTVNRMSREILTNSSIRRGMRLAKKGDLDKLRKHEGMRGLTDSEFISTVEALKRGDLSDAWVRNFAATALNKWQPVSASAMPKAFHDNPDARMLYSMLSYMNRQMNNIRTGVGLNMMTAKDKGINTKEGQEALRDAYKYAAKYTVLFGVVNGLWDQGRQLTDRSKDMDVDTLLDPENITERTIQQIVSNVTSGLVNTKATDYGKGAFDFVPAPISAFSSVGGGLFDAATEGSLEPIAKAAQTYVPGVANVDRAVRSVTGERLLTGDPIAEVRDMIEGR